MTLQPGNIIEGKYRIVSLLGEGGMGAVYLGENDRIHRKVAIKVLHGSVSGKADVVQRFEREAQAAGRIGSEHIVEVLDLGNLPTGERFMVMEFLDGESLGQRIKKRKRLTVQELAPIMHGLLEGLAAAHDAGIVHRDLKPDNVYLVNLKNQRDFVKILDFGVSKFSALDNDMSMTKTGAVMGTPYYMSPEQARGGKIDARSDLYSVGVVMYQAITGRLPFQAQTFNELVFKIALEAPDPAELVVPNLDPAFAAIIAKAMIRDVNIRFQTAREFQAAVAQWMVANPSAEINPGRLPTLQPGMQFDPRMSQQNPLVGTGPLGLPPGFDPRMSQQGPIGSIPPGFDPRMSQQGLPGAAQLGMSQAGLGMSHAGLTMTPPAPRGNGAMIAIGLLGTLLVAASGLIVYKFVLDKPAPTPTVQAASAQVKPAAPPPAPTPTPTPVATPVPTPAADASAAAPVESAEPVPTVAGTTPPLPTGARTAGTGTATGTGGGKKPPPTPTGTGTGGRKMGSDL